MDSPVRRIKSHLRRNWTDAPSTPAALVGILGNWSKGEGPVYRRLARAVAAAIERGEIEPGTRLPAERVLAEALAVSRTTVVSAYEELRGQERVESRRGSGTRVRGSLSRGPGLRLREDPSGSFRRHPVYRSLVEGPGDTIEFLGAHLPAPDAARARDRPRRREGGPAELSRGPGYLPMGLPALRAAIARHLTGWGCRHHRRPGHGDPRRAAGHRAGGRALPRARRHGRRGRSDVPRVDRHLHRPGRPAGRRAGGRRRRVAQPPARARQARRAAADLPHADVSESDGRRDAGGLPPRARAALEGNAHPDPRGQHAGGPLARRKASRADRGVRSARRRC